MLAAEASLMNAPAETQLTAKRKSSSRGPMMRVA